MPESSTHASRIDHPVAIVGAGPVGLALALGLARHGVRSVLVEKQHTTSRTSKAPGMHVRTREVLRQWGVESRFLEAGTLWRDVTMHSVEPERAPLLSLEFAELEAEADRPGLLILEQNETERLLLEAVRESEMCEVRFGAEAIALDQDRTGARLTVRENGAEQVIAAHYVVGCDGAGSFVRGALGLPFEGTTYTLQPILADVRIDDDRDALPQPRVWTGDGGYAFAVRLRAGLWRLVHLPHGEPHKADVSEDEVVDQIELLLGGGVAEVLWASRFRIHVRASPRFRVGRVLLAGDAAHVHSPASGQGMNGGIQDVHNLAWKLAHALRGGNVERLLESYEQERRDVVVETTSRYTDRVTRLFIQAPPIVRDAAWLAARTMLRSARMRRRSLRRLAMLDLDYETSPLLGRRARGAGVRLPNPLLRAPDGRAVRLYDLLPNAALLIEVGDGGTAPGDVPVEHVIRIGAGGYEEPTGMLRELLGRHDGWILVRPDAHVAWARRRPAGMAAAVRHALGWDEPAPVRKQAAADRGPRRRRERRERVEVLGTR